MYCKNCYSRLSAAEKKCEKCSRPFDVDNPKTFLARPFPSRWNVVFTVAATTIAAAAVAWVVAFHQAASTSGH